MNFHQIFLAQKCVGSDASQCIVTEVDVSHAGQNGEDVELRNSIDTGIDVLEVVVISERVVIAHGVNIVGFNVQHLQAGGYESVVKP